MSQKAVIYGGDGIRPRRFFRSALDEVMRERASPEFRRQIAQAEFRRQRFEALRRVPQPGHCRICGCTEDDCSGCVAIIGEACSWADEAHTLCTACEMG
jgi:hypothetical protein